MKIAYSNFRMIFVVVMILLLQSPNIVSKSSVSLNSVNSTITVDDYIDDLLPTNNSITIDDEPDLVDITTSNNSHNQRLVYLPKVFNSHNFATILEDPNSSADDHFGQNTASYNNYILITSGSALITSNPLVHIVKSIGNTNESVTSFDHMMSLGTDAKYQDGFGSALAINNYFLVIAAPSDRLMGPDTGVVYTFLLNSPNDTSIDNNDLLHTFDDFPVHLPFYDSSKLAYQVLAPGVIRSKSLYGHSVALCGLQMVVGAPGHYVTYPAIGKRVGAAFLHHFDTDLLRWKEIETIYPVDEPFLTPGSRFGESIAISSTLLVISAPEFHTGEGCVYLYPMDTLPEVPPPTQLTASDGMQHLYTLLDVKFRRFGRSLLLHKDLLMVSTISQFGIGHVFIYQSLPTGWQVIDILTNHDPTSDFGMSMNLFSSFETLTLHAKIVLPPTNVTLLNDDGSDGYNVTFVDDYLDQFTLPDTDLLLSNDSTANLNDTLVIPPDEELDPNPLEDSINRYLHKTAMQGAKAALSKSKTVTFTNYVLYIGSPLVPLKGPTPQNLRSLIQDPLPTDGLTSSVHIYTFSILNNITMIETIQTVMKSSNIDLPTVMEVHDSVSYPFPISPINSVIEPWTLQQTIQCNPTFQWNDSSIFSHRCDQFGVNINTLQGRDLLISSPVDITSTMKPAGVVYLQAGHVQDVLNLLRSQVNVIFNDDDGGQQTGSGNDEINYFHPISTITTEDIIIATVLALAFVPVAVIGIICLYRYYPKFSSKSFGLYRAEYSKELMNTNEEVDVELYTSVGTDFRFNPKDVQDLHKLSSQSVRSPITHIPTSSQSKESPMKDPFAIKSYRILSSIQKEFQTRQRALLGQSYKPYEEIVSREDGTRTEDNDSSHHANSIELTASRRMYTSYSDSAVEYESLHSTAQPTDDVPNTSDIATASNTSSLSSFVLDDNKLKLNEVKEVNSNYAMVSNALLAPFQSFSKSNKYSTIGNEYNQPVSSSNTFFSNPFSSVTINKADSADDATREVGTPHHIDPVTGQESIRI